MAIRIFVSGGTFDKECDEIHGKLFFKTTHLRETLESGRSRLKVNISTLMMIDSLDMTAADRERILSECRRAQESKIVRTYGTDTMVKTAKVLATARLPKTIVLTGAMIPFKFGSSDGLFNLGSTLAFIQTMKQGVYAVMNGRCFNYDNVRKNTATGDFEPLKP